jgi:hypothetical protein
VGAIREGIAEAPGGWISEVPPAGLAGAGVWRYRGKIPRLLPALENVEADAAQGCYFGDGNFENLCELRRIALQAIDKRTTRFGATSISIVTPEEELKTKPVSPSDVASL